jgi:hypothetical protein
MKSTTFPRLLPALLSAILVFSDGGVTTASDEAAQRTNLSIGPIGDWALAADNATLIVSRPNAAELVYLDTFSHVELKRIEVDFAPNQLAIQNDTLFASVRGASIVYALDAETGDVIKRYKLPGEPVIDLCCHSKQGHIFAANLNEEIYAIEPDNGDTAKTKGRGTMLAIDPNNGSFLFAGTNRPGQDFIEFQHDGNVDRMRLVTMVNRASVLKYVVNNGQLQLVAGNTNAAFGESGNLAVSHDGKRFAMAAGGGWRSMTSQRFHYVIAIFETEDMETMLGQVELGAYPRAIAFHPILNLGAAIRHGGSNIEVKVFKASSLTDRQVIKLDAQHPGPLLAHRLMFCGRGATLVHHYRDTLTMISLDLSEEETELLKDQQDSP